MVQVFVRQPVKRYFGSRANPDIGVHNIKKAIFLMVVQLMSDADYPACPVRIIASRAPGVSLSYWDSKIGKLEKFGLITRKPSLANSGRPVLVIKLTKAGRDFLDDFKSQQPERYAAIKERILSKNADLSSLDASLKLGRVAQLVHSSVHHESIPAEPPAKPPEPVKLPIEAICVKSNGRLFSAYLSQSRFNLVEVDYAPILNVEAHDSSHARHTFDMIKSGKLKVYLQGGQIGDV